MEELEKREKEASIAKLEAEAKKLKAEEESIRVGIAFNIAKLGLSAIAVVTGLIIGLGKLMGP